MSAKQNGYTSPFPRCWANVARALLLVVLALPATACSQSAEPEGEAAAQISKYNHTPEYIHQSYINGQYGGNVRAYGGGGKFACCISYPRQWSPSLKATVRWTTSESGPNGSGVPTWHEKVVPIEHYNETGTTLNVHFLPDGQVRLIITSLTAGHPDYPGPPAPEAPADFPYKY